MYRTKMMGRWFMVAGALLTISTSVFASGSPRQDTQQRSAPDNSKSNQGDGSKAAVTADQQTMNSTDTNITKQIRSSIYADKSLSIYAHNIKIVTQNGAVTLKGPVRSEDEKSNVEAKAAAVAGAAHVKSQLTIAPSKS